MLLLAKNSKAGCLFRPNFLKEVVIEIQKMEHPRQKFSKYPPGGRLLIKDGFYSRQYGMRIWKQGAL